MASDLDRNFVCGDPDMLSFSLSKSALDPVNENVEWCCTTGFLLISIGCNGRASATSSSSSSMAFSFSSKYVLDRASYESTDVLSRSLVFMLDRLGSVGTGSLWLSRWNAWNPFRTLLDSSHATLACVDHVIRVTQVVGARSHVPDLDLFVSAAANNVVEFRMPVQCESRSRVCVELALKGGGLADVPFLDHSRVGDVAELAARARAELHASDCVGVSDDGDLGLCVFQPQVPDFHLPVLGAR
ncbi:hypothetical protein OGAPHI_006461 [Ogataea philodendri]|uniref:Uncharacterized protein n=1 Tax=Ogataea philodendri TaxID=1378263 RepID=A0A9P8NWK7_9ASCO|nr:uncharacterized protein OGAPHI_006461 [Ogataea philodendri]KAH3661613.1 hypothetical protein OGAPHI_006461 [Ogataea philodendri]